MRIVVQIFAGLYVGNGLDVVVDFVRRKRRIGLRRDQANWRIVNALLVFVLVPLNRPLLRVPGFAFATLPFPRAIRC